MLGYLRPASQPVRGDDLISRRHTVRFRGGAPRGNRHGGGLEVISTRNHSDTVRSLNARLAERSMRQAYILV